jgi:tripartite-type tricarboxylate transporter receptor subunit TctC
VKTAIKKAIAATLFAISIAVSPAAAKWPEDKTVTVVINFPPGGTIDMVGRLVADGLARKYPKATFVVENRSGANGNIGQAYVGRSAPDGYTFLLTAPGPASYNTLTFKSLPYDPIQDFEGVTQLTSDTMGFLVSKKRKPELQTLGGFLAYAKANKGKLNVGYGGVGSAGHMTTLAIQDQVGAEFNLVPYRGGGALTPDLLSGNLDAIVNFTGNYFAQLESGDFTVIGVARDDRSAFLPDAPTLKESGVNFSAAPWTIMQVRKGVPREIVNEMAQAVNEILREPTVAKRLVDARIQAAPSSPEAVDALVRAELERWRPVIKKYDISVE